MKKPALIQGGIHQDARGTITFNNTFSEQLLEKGIKKVYTLENANPQIVRAWQGHAVEQRWFSPLSGMFRVLLIPIDDWEKPSPDVPQLEFILKVGQMEVLHVPAGYASSIQAMEESSVLLVMADHGQGEIQDEYRFPPDYFQENKP